MNATIVVKKIGNHCYPDINHDYPEDLVLDEKIEKIFSMVDKYQYGIINLYFFEQYEIIESGTLQFDETDMVRFLTTDDDLQVSFYINDHRFQVSSNLLALLESQYKFNFQDNLYKIDFW